MTGNYYNSVLLKELNIYQWIFSFFGLNLPTFLLYRSEKDLKYYLALIIYLLYSLLLLTIAIWTAYIHNHIVYKATLRHSLDSVTEAITYIQNIVTAVIYLIMQYKAWCGYQQLLGILLLIKKLEQNFLKICPDLFRHQNLSLRNRLFSTTGLALIIFIPSLIISNSMLLATDMTRRDTFFFVFFVVTLQMKFLEYGIYVQIIYVYLKVVLNSLDYLKNNVDNETMRSVPLPWYYPKMLKQNRKLLIEVWFLIYKLEYYFAWPIFSLFFYNGLVVMCTINWAYVQYLYETTAMYQWFRLVYICVISLNMLLLCYLTQKSIIEYQQFSHLLLSFKLYPHDVKMMMGIKEYSLQLMHQSITFTCNGYMNIDLSYYGKTNLAILAYAVILLQFKLTDISEGVVKATKRIMYGNLENCILLKELKIYQWIFCIFGLNFPPFLIYRREKDVKYYIVLVVYLIYSLLLLACAAWATHRHNFVVSKLTHRFNLDSLTELITYIHNIVLVVIQLLYEYKTWYCHQNLLDILLLIAKLEHNIFKMCPHMFKYQILRKRLLLTTAIFSLILLIFLIYLNYYLISGEMALLGKIVVAFFMVSLQLKSLEYGAFIQLIYEYLKMLLKSLNELNENVENESKRKISLDCCFGKTMRQNQTCLMEIWSLVNQLELYFGWPILLLFFYNGIDILTTMSWAYVQYNYESRFVFQMFRLTFVSVILSNMLLLCHLAQNFINKYQQFSELLPEFKLYPHDVEMLFNIKEYSLQLMHQSLKFTCNGYMNIDLTYFGKITLAILGYTTILLQFKLTDVSEGAIRATKRIFGRF